MEVQHLFCLEPLDEKAVQQALNNEAFQKYIEYVLSRTVLQVSLATTPDQAHYSAGRLAAIRDIVYDMNGVRDIQ